MSRPKGRYEVEARTEVEPGVLWRVLLAAGLAVVVGGSVFSLGMLAWAIG